MSALLVVDVQYDFISGSLAVEGARDILSVVYTLLDDHTWDLIIASQASLKHITQQHNHGENCVVLSRSSAQLPFICT
jgi:nicotinamidase-related amidase